MAALGATEPMAGQITRMADIRLNDAMATGPQL
jgi:hypothetical protein